MAKATNRPAHLKQTFSMFQKFKAWLVKQLVTPENMAPVVHSTAATSLVDDGAAQHVVPYDENLLERSRTQWQFGDWESLATLDRDELQHHPDRAKLALLAASGHLQQGNSQAARQFTRLAQDWGCSRKLISQILISGVHNSLGRTATIAGDQTRSLKHFNSAVAIGNPGSDQRLLAQARLNAQCTQLGVPATQLLPSSKNADSIRMANPRAAYAPAPPKPLVRTIHHLSCTGGTLFAKCLAAQPNVILLNEIDPFSKLSLDQSGKSQFSPRDIISLLHQSGHDFDDETIADVFVEDIRTIHSRLSNSNKDLVLREHNHSAYLFGTSVRGGKTLIQTLESSFELRSIITVRNPIDSYLSLKAFGWLHFEPPNFNEYCNRYLSFLTDYSSIRVFRYEDFVIDSLNVMQEICKQLNLDYTSEFPKEFFNFNFSGDSGRRGDVISPRERRPFDQIFAAEVNESKSFKELSARLGYDENISSCSFNGINK